MKQASCSGLLFTAALALGIAAPAAADGVGEFYKGQTVRVIIPSGLGGSIGLYGKLFADHIGNHIPGKPTVVVQDMAGGGGVRALAWGYNAGPRDGSVISQVLSPALAAPALRGAKFDPTDLYWLGSISPRASVLGVWHTAPAKTFEDAKKTEIVLASGGVGSATHIVPVMLNAMTGTKFKTVTGYKGGGTMNMAMEAGEVHGRYNFWTGWTTTKADWLRDRKVRVLAQFGPRIPELPDVPSGTDLVSDPDHRKMLRFMEISEFVGLGFWIPMQVPEDRKLALRAAFMNTMKDPAFLADAEKRKAPVDAVGGEEIGKVVAESLDISPALIAELKKMIGFDKKN